MNQVGFFDWVVGGDVVFVFQFRNAYVLVSPTFDIRPQFFVRSIIRKEVAKVFLVGFSTGPLRFALDVFVHVPNVGGI